MKNVNSLLKGAIFYATLYLQDKLDTYPDSLEYRYDRQKIENEILDLEEYKLKRWPKTQEKL